MCKEMLLTLNLNSLVITDQLVFGLTVVKRSTRRDCAKEPELNQSINIYSLHIINKHKNMFASLEISKSELFGAGG